jgi:hypothetical protein
VERELLELPHTKEATMLAEIFMVQLVYVVRTFRTLVWQFKRVSGSSGLKVQAAIAC